jgi:hypothetical protein
VIGCAGEAKRAIFHSATKAELKAVPEFKYEGECNASRP